MLALDCYRFAYYNTNIIFAFFNSIYITCSCAWEVSRIILRRVSFLLRFGIVTISYINLVINIKTWNCSFRMYDNRLPPTPPSSVICDNTLKRVIGCDSRYSILCTYLVFDDPIAKNYRSVSWRRWGKSSSKKDMCHKKGS